MINLKSEGSTDFANIYDKIIPIFVIKLFYIKI
jgi:hypothetical protein